jgi:hypothetical protein
MSIHLRTITDESGDTVDYAWFCSRSCYAFSFEAPSLESVDDDHIDEGGASPCGAESDFPDFCATCSNPIRNPLTTEGRRYAQDLIADWHGDAHVRDALISEYNLIDIRTRDHVIRMRYDVHTLSMLPDYQGADGRTRWHYRLRTAGVAVFCGRDFETPDHWTHIEPTHALAGLLGFLSLRPGDTDAEYFDSYSPSQMEWAETYAEELSGVVSDLEG